MADDRLSQLTRITLALTRPGVDVNERSERARLFRLRVSRANSLVFRIRFVFPVGHLFPLVVSQDLIHAQSSSPPRRSGRAPLTHPAPSHHLSHRTASCTSHRDQVNQAFRGRERVLLQKRIELRPVQVAALTPATQVSFRHPTSMIAIRHQ